MIKELVKICFTYLLDHYLYDLYYIYKKQTDTFELYTKSSNTNLFGASTIPSTTLIKPTGKTDKTKCITSKKQTILYTI